MDWRLIVFLIVILTGCAYFTFPSFSADISTVLSSEATMKGNGSLDTVVTAAENITTDGTSDAGSLESNSQNRTQGMYRVINNGVPVSLVDRLAFLQDRCELRYNIDVLKSTLKETRFEEKYLEIIHANISEPEKIFLEHSYNIAACKNSKVASRNLQRLFYVIAEHTKDHNPDHLDYHTPVQHYKTNTLKNTLNQSLAEKVRSNYTNIIFVREPLERLVSAFRGKSGAPWHGGRKPEFDNLPLLDYLLMVLSGEVNDSHSRPFYKQCGVCSYPYNFIGTIDTFRRDASILLENIGAKDHVYLPTRDGTGYEKQNSSSVTVEYFQKVPNDIIHKLWEHYVVDYYLFGFKYPEYVMHD